MKGETHKDSGYTMQCVCVVTSQWTNSHVMATNSLSGVWDTQHTHMQGCPVHPIAASDCQLSLSQCQSLLLLPPPPRPATTTPHTHTPADAAASAADRLLSPSRPHAAAAAAAAVEDAAACVARLLPPPPTPTSARVAAASCCACRAASSCNKPCAASSASSLLVFVAVCDVCVWVIAEWFEGRQLVGVGVRWVSG